MAGGVHGRGCAWQEGCVWQGGHAWQGVCGRGVCMAGGGVHGRGDVCDSVTCMPPPFLADTTRYSQ